MTTLIVGATGRTGGRTLDQLLGCGVDVRAGPHNEERLPQFSGAVRFGCLGVLGLGARQPVFEGQASNDSQPREGCESQAPR